MKKLFRLIPILSLFISCTHQPKEYKYLSNGVKLKLLAFGENEKQYNNDCSVVASIQLYAKNKLVFYQDEYSVFSLNKSPFDILFSELNEGDSASCIVPIDAFDKAAFKFNTKNWNTDTLSGTIKIQKYLSREELNSFLERNDHELVEQVKLKKYLTFINTYQNRNGVIFIPEKNGTGETVSEGKTVWVHYTGSFLNGIVFDNTYNRSSFEYQYGTPNQMIKGFEIALSGMKKNEKAKIIIPSQLAFGDKGSATGIVPPFTTVVYELEIIDIK
ncbi:MAG: FKBP-type peptidyl-prolyl cis-trans isomerase [Flavobacteriales bacterium]|nr:FKBP-type peptidyl-prolyl cis-trans isomerase [Flavobacteriales bacterium]